MKRWSARADELAFEQTTAVAAASTSSSATVLNRTSVCRSSPPPRRGRALPRTPGGRTPGRSAGSTSSSDGRGLEDATLAAYFDWGQPVVHHAGRQGAAQPSATGVPGTAGEAPWPASCAGLRTRRNGRRAAASGSAGESAARSGPPAEPGLARHPPCPGPSSTRSRSLGTRRPRRRSSTTGRRTRGDGRRNRTHRDLDEVGAGGGRRHSR